jgi:leucyl aminopeptidase
VLLPGRDGNNRDRTAESGGAEDGGAEYRRDKIARLADTAWAPPADCRGEVERYLDDLNQGRTSPGTAGTVHVLPRPGQTPGHVVLVGVGTADEGGWRAAGAALVRAAGGRFTTVTVHMPTDLADSATAAFAEAAWLASYRYRLGADPPDRAPILRRVTLAAGDPAAAAPVARAAATRRTTTPRTATRRPATPTPRTAVDEARAVADAVFLARDLVNAPSLQKSPRWFADRIANAAARRPGVTVSVRDEAALASEGFGGILAVGAGSTRPPRLVELTWKPRGARTHIVLVGKGITFDSGGIVIKPVEAMKLMRKDMGGAAAVCAAVLGAADLGLPVRLTALAPLAENMISGSAFRPGDVVRHYGGATTEVFNTDAEGRLVVGDALAYAARRLRPDVLIDLATLTGAQHVALGKRTAALFSADDELAAAITRAGGEVGEHMWRMPLADAYLPLLRSDIADLNNAPPGMEAGAITAALFLREFTGALRERWVHIDMSSPSWIETTEGPLTKGATGWGVRTLLRWLRTV